MHTSIDFVYNRKKTRIHSKNRNNTKTAVIIFSLLNHCSGASFSKPELAVVVVYVFVNLCVNWVVN